MLNLARHMPFAPLGAVCALAVLTAGAPASAQEGVEEFTVIGSSQQVDVRRISASVNFQDLDLTTKQGRDQFNQRIWRTAGELCDRLGEPNYAVGMAFACQDKAFEAAAPSRRKAIKQAQLRVAGAAPATTITIQMATNAKAPAR
ncbi:UrcA family protein [Phenylobacterium sp. LjRoot219]|uniref:UrcA family protein n=1 Tax=Phenylobacterium sp. LjRoot219 TaxID=3342283 RepID=UPI003ED09226